MSLSFTFKLTPAQTKMLVTIAYDVREPELGCPAWHHIPGVPDHFVSICKNLESKGLITHDNSRKPTYIATAEGKALAALIVRDAAQIVSMTRGAEERAKRWEPKPAKRKVPLP